MFITACKRMNMFGLKIIRQRDFDAMEGELKSYYGKEGDDRNAYMHYLRSVMSGQMELPPITQLTRERIADLYALQGPVQGVVSYIARNVGDVSQYLLLSTRKDNKPVDSHPVLNLLGRPNDRYTLRKFITAWAINKLLFGDAWVYVMREEVGKNKGMPKQMYVIPSHRISAKWGAGDTSALMEGVNIIGAVKDKTIPFTEVFESFDYNLDDTTMYGTSKIVAAATYLSVMDKGIRRENTALENGGVATLITPKPDNISGVPRKSDVDQLEREFNHSSNVNKTKVLPTPVETHQLGDKLIDLDILSTHKEAVTMLCFLYQIPVDLYYGQSKYENAKEAKRTIYEQNAIPMCNEFAEDLLNFLGMSNEYRLEVDTQKIDVLQASPSDSLDALGKMCATLNEKREVMGYDRIEEAYADEPMIPMGTQFGYDADPYDITSE